MTSLDDSIISDQNLMLLDNVTNYTRASVDYFHHDFDYASPEIGDTWALLLKMRKHKLLRLPSCSTEDDDDYSMYLKRLHHCLWRRWAIHEYNLQNRKLDPLAINWNKETDVTVLYGPALSKNIETAAKKTPVAPATDADSIHSDPGATLDYEDTYSSSIDSQTSSIFDSPSILKTTTSNTEESAPTPKKSLKFNYIVARRDIDSSGKISECNVSINDIDYRVADEAAIAAANSSKSGRHYNSVGALRGGQSIVDYNSDPALYFDSSSYDYDYDYGFDDEDFVAYSSPRSGHHSHHSHHHNHHNHVRAPVHH
ncbi:hypothetical protein DAKH74_000440 [Maudiozyma humilis]|uniref:Nitrogen regulatory protein areA GATA-like domain-containing protein n=1 Tax=Maudiozyma humilis TaxID=51915 RepID=A0AAV5RRT5_MAUHU|nr:hypothetical protein DAKH74_000440 [Kazachstania humilis]